MISGDPRQLLRGCLADDDSVSLIHLEQDVRKCRHECSSSW